MRERNINFSLRKRAILRYFRLEFNKIASRNPKEGYANIVPDQNEEVEGVLYEITEQDLSKLDRREGYPKHYDKIILKVGLDDGQEVEAVVYIAQPSKVANGLKPSGTYMKHLLAAKDILSENYCRKLKAFPVFG